MTDAVIVATARSPIGRAFKGSLVSMRPDDLLVQVMRALLAKVPAFAAQVIPSMRRLGIPHEKLNVHGGAIALGHPFGMTGARIMTTLLHGLERRDGVIGLEAMCVGGGQGMAMIVERL
jgi:acetyl-CoA acetyltransferase